MATSIDDLWSTPGALLLAASIGAGLLCLAVARRVSRPAEIRKARRRVSGLLLEMWLYGDDPVQVFRTQWELAGANLRYLALLVPVALACAPPMVLLWHLLDPLLGHAPIPIGGAAIVTAHLGDRNGADPQLSTPEGIRVETPALRLEGGDVLWRIRAARDAEGDLQVTTPHGVFASRVSASRALRYLSPTAPIEIAYPARRIHLFGIEWPWEAWLLVLSAATAVVLHRRFGVSL